MLIGPIKVKEEERGGGCNQCVQPLHPHPFLPTLTPPCTQSLPRCRGACSREGGRSRRRWTEEGKGGSGLAWGGRLHGELESLFDVHSHLYISSYHFLSYLLTHISSIYLYI